MTADPDAAAVGGAERARKPTPGDLSVCIGCGAFMRYEIGLTLRLLSLEEVGALPDDTREAMTSIRAVARIASARGELPAQHRCPACQRQMQYAIDLEGTPSAAKPGQPAICAGCGSFLRFNERMDLELMSLEDVGCLSDAVRIALQRSRRAFERGELSGAGREYCALPMRAQCPKCQTKIFATRPTVGPSTCAEAGDIGVCAVCLSYLIFDQHLEVHELSAKQFDALPLAPRLALLAQRARVRDERATRTQKCSTFNDDERPVGTPR